MGAGCAKRDTAIRRVSSPTVPERIRTHTLGNFTFQVYGNLHIEQKKAGKDFRTTPAWETTAAREEVERKRKEFWDTRVEGDIRVWETLRNILNEPDMSNLYTDQAKLMIKLSGLKLMGDLIMISYDETGRRYDLPPFIINEPEKYGTTKEAPKIPTNYQEKMMSFKIRCTRFNDFDITLGSLMTIQLVKGRYAEHHKLNWEKVRLFYNGRECKNELTLVQCGIEDGVVIQAAVGI